ncbi:MAG: hypothetical protein EBS06_05165 [Proteobacteria bacterium]|nr:hypothetical protein [Pseudomonadota bacterium]
MSDNHLAQGPSSFEMQQHSAKPSFGGGNVAAVNGTSGTAAPVISGKDMNELLKSGNISDFGNKGIGTVFHIEGIAENNILDVFDGNFVSPGNINAFQNMGELNGMGNMQIGEATSITKGVNLNIENNTSFASKGGQEH